VGCWTLADGKEYVALDLGPDAEVVVRTDQITCSADKPERSSVH
jgi:hypothetical protein